MSGRASSKSKRPNKPPPSQSPFHRAVTSEITPAPSNDAPKFQRPGLSGRQNRQAQLATPSMPKLPGTSTRVISALPPLIDRAWSAPPDFDDTVGPIPQVQSAAKPAINMQLGPEEVQAMQVISEVMQEITTEGKKVMDLLQKAPNTNPAESPEMMAKIDKAMKTIERGDETIATYSDSLRSSSAHPDLGARREKPSAARHQLKTASVGSVRGGQPKETSTTATRSAGPLSRR